MKKTILVALACWLTLGGLHAQQKKPNVVFIISDDHAYQAISAYGSQLAQTPNIDRIAKEGAVFKNALVTNSICGPARACFLTGKYSHKNGFKVNNGTKFDMSQQHFPRILHQNGYQVAWIGKMHLESLPQDFDYFNIVPDQGRYYNPSFIGPKNDTVRHQGYITNIITNMTEEWIQQRDTSKPFFLVVGEKATHREWQPDLQDLGAYDDRTFPLPSSFKDKYVNRVAAANQDMTISTTMRLREDLKVGVDYNKDWLYRNLNPEQRKAYEDYYDKKVTKEFNTLQLSGDALTEWKYQRYLKDYLSTAKSLDRNVGKILDYLDQKGLAENTIVIYCSDQGFYMGEHGWFDKRFMYEESLKTPFVMRWPKKIKPGTVVNDLMLNVDWAPTMLDIAGVKAPADMQGVSFLPLLSGKKTAWRDAAFYHYYEYPEPHKVSPHFGVRTKEYTLIRFYGPADNWELYDLKKDPGQINNLYGKPGYEKVTNKLKARMKSLIEVYEDDEASRVLAKEV
ncbi:arylsulfatase A-like enzyme [Chitinophaga skermanii]|uniref:Arylsulfatase A-like enzyme n=1 Tax=Chitinophaga skermanii TaxID=331697 RepID=A0A327QEG4_9BACT|nr:sulfatase [Chitinophaga skermanii]RAJ01663.1 arylsulfatase A-like enzyme [Chitinophaga skermanii]